LSVDPVTNDANTGRSFNRYSYAENNPYKFIDPDGREIKWAGNPALIPWALGHMAKAAESPMGAVDMAKLNAPGVIYTIRLNELLINNADADNKHMNFDPKHAVEVETEAGKEQAPGDVTLMHEVSHMLRQEALRNEKDRAKHERENIRNNENPYRKQRVPRLPPRKITPVEPKVG
jgi:hypothetical protein